MDKILALYDCDVFYATRFMEYFIRRNETGFEISVFTRMDTLEEFLRLNHVEILLLGDQITLEEQVLENIKYMYQLTENPFYEKGAKGVSLNKYQSVQALMNELLADYSEKENETRIKYNSSQTEIISVYSPITGKENISFAWSLCSLLSEEKKVLFIPLDLLPAQLLPSLNNNSQCLTDFIYYLKEDSNVDKIQKLLRCSGKLSVLSGILHGADILSLSIEDVQRWISELKEYSDYQTVVFYLGYYTETAIELMKLSDRVIVTTLDKPYELSALQEWERQMNQLGMNTKQDKFQFVKLNKQDEPEQLPLTTSELMNSVSWAEARHYLNC